MPLPPRVEGEAIEPVLYGYRSGCISLSSDRRVMPGFLDAATLAAVLAEVQARDRHIESLATLCRYERGRRGDNPAMWVAMDRFKALRDTPSFGGCTAFGDRRHLERHRQDHSRSGSGKRGSTSKTASSASCATVRPASTWCLTPGATSRKRSRTGSACRTESTACAATWRRGATSPS